MLSFSRIRISLVVAAAMAVALPGHGAGDAGAWPHARPITWLVGFPPGGSLDTLTRIAARQLTEKTGQSVVVENKPGASGAIALLAAARSAPDGYTLITVPGPLLSHTRTPEIGQELVGIATLAQGPMVLVGGAATTPATVAELVAAMRSNPAAWSYGSSGNGTSQHLAGELFNTTAGTAMRHIPYKGGGQAVIDVVGGQVPLAILGATPVLPHIQSGKLKAYAVTTRYRIDSLPDVPTMQEAGIQGFDAAQWYVIAAPAGVPADVQARLNGWINAIAASAEMKPALLASGSIAGQHTARETQAFVDADTRRWKALADKAKLDLR